MKAIEELWEAVKGFEGKYEISTLGNVKSLSRWENFMGHKRSRKGRILKPVHDNHGYLMVCLRDGLKNYNRTIHKLVANAFIPNPLNKATVNHIDGIKTNNHVDNLEWATISENTKHAHATGLAKSPRIWAGKFGLHHISSKGVKQIDKATGNVICVFGSQAEAAEKTGIAQWRISYHLRGMPHYETTYNWSHAYSDPKMKETLNLKSR